MNTDKMKQVKFLSILIVVLVLVSCRPSARQAVVGARWGLTPLRLTPLRLSSVVCHAKLVMIISATFYFWLCLY